MIRAIIDIHFRVCSHAQVNFDSRNDCYSMGLLLERFIVDSECSDCIEVDGDWGYLYISQVKRLRKFFYFSVLGKETTSIIVVPGSIGSF